MRKIALATSNEYSDLTRDDRLVLDKLLYCGVDVEPIVWDAKHVAWHQFDAVFIRSCWDYHLRHEQFFKWIEDLEQEGVTVFNPPEILRKNYHKKYLKALDEKQITVVPTVWADKNAPPQLAPLLADQGWQQAVLKPVISANANETWATSTASAAADQGKLEEMLHAHSEIMVQKFIEEIKTNGEWSFIFFEGEFSHAVLKMPKEGDFRVQEHFSREFIGKRPPPHLLEQAQKVIAAIEDICLYARVDGIEVEKQLLLMELELIEPSLYLDKHPRAPGRFAEAIIAAMNSLSSKEHPH
ncbi:MAG: RimK family alpha-L-glutamate ligase [bacterium]